MTNRHAHSLIRFIRQVVGPDGPNRDADERLLRRFALQCDQAAFAALVARHGPMVLGVCGRVLRDAGDVEDAFQATFLVLARKARSLASPHLLAPWLYGVARRTALEAKGRTARRRARERQLVDTATADPTIQAAWADLRPVLDEEIARLPERYRVPFVMCYLEGRTNGETARLIGCPEGTVASRLAWARQRLRARLTRRGVTLSAGVCAAVLSGKAVVAPALAGRTAEAAASFAGYTPAARLVPANVGSLAAKVLKQMFWTKVRKATGMLLTLCLLLGGGGALVGSSRGSGRDGGEAAGREVIVAQPLARDITPDEEFTGITAVDSIDVRTRLAGVLKTVAFKDGTEVKQGDLLAEIDAAPFQAELDRAEATLAMSKAHLKQAEKESEDYERPIDILSARVVIEKAKASLASAQQTRDVARANLDATRVTAPIAGRAYGRAALGKQLQANDVVAAVVGPGPVFVDFEAPLRLLPVLADTRDAAGLPVVVGLAEEKGFPRRGTVSLTGARVDADKGTLRLRAVLPNDGITSGQAARLRLATGKPYRALLVPQGAVHSEKAGSFLLVVNDKNETERRRVELGKKSDGLRVVKGGLKADEWVVLDSSFGADAGATVAPRKVSLLPEEAGKGRVGGDFMVLNSLEYQVPVMANDKVWFVPFVDSGTVEPRMEIKDYRVSAGAGARFVVPMLGPDPIALDFGFPIDKGSGAGARTVFLKDNGLSMTLPLEHASAADAAQLAKRLYRDHLAPKGRLVISADERTNSLSVEGTTEQVLEVVKLVAGLEELARRNPKSAALRLDDQLLKNYSVETALRRRAKDALAGAGPRLGVSVEALTPALVEQLNLPAGVGLLVTDVVPKSPAAIVGIQANDVLVKIDGAQIPADTGDFVKLIASLKSDTPFDVVVVRKGRKQALGTVRLADGPAPVDKRRAELDRARVEEIKARVALLESDVAGMKDRVAWSERMVKKGYLAEQQAEADRALLKKTEAALERARGELKAISPAKEALEKWLKSRE